MFNIVTHEGYVALAEKLAAIVPVKGDKKRAYFANSGAEADENAVKVARGYTKRPNIITFTGAFHGRTLLTMTMTAKKAYATDMGPLAEGVYRAQFPYFYRNPAEMTEAEAIQYYINSIYDVFEEGTAADTVAAIVVEPLQGEGGFIPAPIEWVKALRKVCDTFCGNAVACAAALKTIEIMERDHLADRSLEIGKIVTDRYNQWKDKYDVIGDVRSMGAMIGLEFVKDKKTKEPNGELVSAIVQECAKNGLMVENSGRWGQVIRFLAPLVITDEQLECGLNILEKAIQTCLK